MDRPPPAPGSAPSTGQRTLAAIVFTDVVGFSARMQRDEMGTLKLLQRDFAEMRRLSAEHDGSVLKTTGDGLLVTFSSAVQAVACALAMQRQFAAEAKEPPASSKLQHRIGIHLGDILVQDQDVMGDGVNIASRLQAEAEPGGICISQTVYDVVKNKLEMQVVSLGPRELKNISQAMPVYRILLEAALSAGGSRSPLPAKPPTSLSAPNRRWLFAGGIAAAVIAIAVLLLWPKSVTPVAVASAPTASAPTPVTPVASPAAAPVAAPATETGITEEEFAREVARRKDVMQQMRTQYLDKYDFDGLVRALHEKSDPISPRPGAPSLQLSAQSMLKMRDWLEFTLARYTRLRPLVVHDLSGDASKDVRLITDPSKRLVFIENGAPKPREWAELKPAALGSIIVSAMRESKPPPSFEIIQGAQAFANFYSLPSMREALAPARMRARNKLN